MRTLTTDRGKSVETPLTDDEAINLLCEFATQGKFESQFANELAAKACFGLSNNQLVWVHIIVLETREAPLDFELPRLMGLLRQAYRKGLKSPRIVGKGWRIAVDENVCSVTLRGKHAGLIGKDNIWAVKGSHSDEEIHAILDFEADPIRHAKAYGTETGACCFCARELSTAESVGVGYGPICADKYGLPWGPDVWPAVRERARRLTEDLVKLKEEIDED
jgi:hypothetical protein